MTITLNTDYDVTLNNALLGYVGETNARPVTVEGLTVDGADRYIMAIDYGDGTVYDVDITGGTWTPTADILRVAQTVSCQISARKYDNGAYTLVKKSKIFSLRIGQALSDGVAPIPSPSVAADALDRIAALGDRITADVQTARSAADTATTAAENAEKSAAAAGLSADTATQAASRAETAQTAAETSATLADTARQCADTARQRAVTHANAAKISADLAAAAAQQTTADKTATADYAETAKTNADSTAADRQAVQEMAEQVTADKTTVTESAVQVAADRTAAENAAQTAQTTAASIPEDYTAMAKKVDSNVEDVSRLKEDIDNKITKFYASNQGETHLADSDSGKIQDIILYGKSSQDGIPSPENPVEIKSVVNPTVKVCGKNLLNSTLQTTTRNGVTCTNNGDGTYTLNGTAKSQTVFNLLDINENIYGGKLVTGCQPYGSGATFNIVIVYFTKDKKWNSENYEVGNGKIIKTKEESSHFLSIGILVRAGCVCNNLIFKPMITEGATSAFEPYCGQTVAIPYTLNAIPVSSGGNITIDNQQYIADYVDVERGKLVRMVDSSKLDNTQSIIGKNEWLLAEPQETDLTKEEIAAFKALTTYYPVTNISVNSEQLEGYTVFNYPISMENGWNYVKQQLNDNRDYIYDMDLQSAEAYVNSEYAVALTELEV